MVLFGLAAPGIPIRRGMGTQQAAPGAPCQTLLSYPAGRQDLELLLASQGRALPAERGHGLVPTGDGALRGWGD